MFRETIWLTFLVLLPVGTTPAQRTTPAPAATSSTIELKGIYNWFEDGRKSEDIFEFWEFACVTPLPKGNCQLRVASFVLGPIIRNTNIFLWIHTSTHIREIQPGLYEIMMGGRLSPCPGLQIIAKTNDKQTEVLDVRGSMRAGTECQTVVEFQPDLKNENRKVPPIFNPIYAERLLRK